MLKEHECPCGMTVQIGMPNCIYCGWEPPSIDVLRAGMNVRIWEDPLTMTKFEGGAKLIREHRPDHGDGLSMWEVEFLDDPGETHLRTINARDAWLPNL